ncbi:hypothetical protein OS493_012109 [Desmophyllum pertusum]|uniref:Uncharacterized protein n=1 Tax=Desmophyllum pertusum TaxID=174260 RepID=A0A9X0DA62_9CNID|nr:hypothetical protein OS493_012109 [Desmophyllum pertusum]
MEGFTPVGIIPPDYECQVCKQVMLEPVILPECGHTYCKSCATRVTNTGPKHCPNCRTPIKSAMITNFTVKTLVLKIRATCNRCQTVEELESLLIHRCPEEELNCSNNGCNEKYKRKDKRAHTDVCQYEIIKCHQCHEDTTGAEKEVHLTQQCKEGRINCPLMCRMRPKRKELQMHISACKERQRECDVPGCHFWGSSMSMEEHRRQRAEKHVSLLLDEREQLHDALFTHDKNYSTRTAETVGSFSWTVDAFKERAAQQGSKNPMTSEEFEIDGKTLEDGALREIKTDMQAIPPTEVGSMFPENFH